MRRFVKLLAVLAAVFLIPLSVGTAQAQEAASVVISQHPDLGSILTDASGRVLYLFTNDERNVSNCSGGCAESWPPLLTTGSPTVGEGLDAERLGTITRADDTTQVTYNGWPLYYFANDAAPGDATGQDRGDVWYVVSMFGGPIQTNALVNTAQHPELGTILADRSGRVQYLFTPDTLNMSNCSGGCAMSWPPLLTIDAPTAGEGVDAERLGTITRADGSTQVTYNGWPLYYFYMDAGPGDASGQDRGDVWYVVSPFGGPIQTSALVQISQHPTLGNILVDRSGRTQYLYTRDERNVSNCSGGCALNWPPLLTVDAPTAGEGLDAERLGTIMRADGSTQVTFNGWPLYYFFDDAAPGDAAGQDRGDVWYVVSMFGGPIQTSALVMTSEHPELGTILTDRSGRVLYLFTNDEPGVSNCSAGCALNWPPLLTIDAPAAGEGADAQQMGAITREDGSMQVTYNDWPLYYFFMDTGPGDASGQGRGDVWYVLDPAGQAIMPAAQPQQPEQPQQPQQPQSSPIAIPPGVGDAVVPVLAQLGLMASAILILSGGAILLRMRAYHVKR